MKLLNFDDNYDNKASIHKGDNKDTVGLKDLWRQYEHKSA